jgi:hypothetical protein
MEDLANYVLEDVLSGIFSYRIFLFEEDLLNRIFGVYQ